MQDFPVQVALSGGLELCADVRRDGFDVALQQVDVREDVVVDPLEDIVGGSLRRGHFVRIVDESVSEGTDVQDVSVEGEMFRDCNEFFHVMWSDRHQR